MEAVVILYLVGIALWLYSFLSVLMNEFKNSINKVIWILVLIFLPISAILYPFIGLKQINKED